MTAQNIYDDPEFLAGYEKLPRQSHGLDGAPEWPDLMTMLPPVAGRRVIDLGCGFGWFSRWAHENGATSVLGIDVSTKMLEHARTQTLPPAVEYRCVDLDELELPSESCDLIFSSLTLHYVHDLERLMSTAAQALAPGGCLVFSVEHPIYSAPTTQRFETSTTGNRIWPLENYLVEGKRVTSWFVEGVVKQHRTVATYVNTVIKAGFVLGQINEWGPSAEEIEAHLERADDQHRPWFLLLQATRTT